MQVERLVARAATHSIHIGIELPVALVGAAEVSIGLHSWVFFRQPVTVPATGLELTGGGISQFQASVGGPGGLRRRG